MSEGNGWMDMSAYPDTDPDAVLSVAQHDLLRSALAVDGSSMPEALWEHLLSVTVGGDDMPVEGDPDVDAAYDGGVYEGDGHVSDVPLPDDPAHEVSVHEVSAHDDPAHDDPASGHVGTHDDGSDSGHLS